MLCILSEDSFVDNNNTISVEAMVKLSVLLFELRKNKNKFNKTLFTSLFSIIKCVHTQKKEAKATRSIFIEFSRDDVRKIRACNT